MLKKVACAGNGYKKATAQIPADHDIIYSGSKPNGTLEADNVVNQAKS